MPGRFRFIPAFSLKGRQWLGLRGWDGIPLHPPLAHFPIAGYVLAAAFDAVSLLSRGQAWAHDAFVAATWVMASGATVSLLTVTTGLLDWRHTPRGSQVRRQSNAHAVTMLTVTVLVMTCLAIRVADWPAPAGSSIPITALSVACALVILVGAAIGADLVYTHGVRVDNAVDSFAFHPSSVDLLPDGRPIGEAADGREVGEETRSPRGSQRAP